MGPVVVKGRQGTGSAPIKVEFSGDLLNSISRIVSGVADLAEVLFFSLSAIVLALTAMVVRRLQRH